jgi:bifunctional DNA-binding transcriptional regulator/antitoxin component of YhaV-PrlF toxin-antitoxin module
MARQEQQAQAEQSRGLPALGRASIHRRARKEGSVRINTMEILARKVNRQRRVGLPTLLAKRSGIEPKRWVTVGPAKGSLWTLQVKPVDPPKESWSVRDPYRPRRVTKVMQVTVPKPWMEKVGLKPEGWVFLSSLGEGRGLRMTPQARTRLRQRRVGRES